MQMIKDTFSNDVNASLMTRQPPYLEPAHVEEKLEEGEDRDVKVDLVAGILLARVQELPTEHC